MAVVLDLFSRRVVSWSVSARAGNDWDNAAMVKVFPRLLLRD